MLKELRTSLPEMRFALMQSTGTKLPTTPKRPSSPPTRWVFSTSTFRGLRRCWLGFFEEVSERRTCMGRPRFCDGRLRNGPCKRSHHHGATEDQKERWLRNIAEEGPASYAVTEPERAQTSPPAKPPPSKTAMITSSTVQKCGSPGQVMRISSLSLRRPTPMQVIEACRVSSWKKTRQAFPWEERNQHGSTLLRHALHHL